MRMRRLTFHALIALLTFTAGVSSWDTYRAFANYGLAPIRGVFRVKAPLASAAVSKSLTRLNPQPSEEHPPAARSMTPPDVVLIHFTTGLDGHVKDVRALSGDLEFHQRAIGATYRIRFSRRRYRGHRVGTAGLIVYKFAGGRPILVEMHKGPAIEFTCGEAIRN